MQKLLLCCVFFLCACSADRETAAEDPAGPTTLVQNAFIVDGSGAAGYQGDVRFDGDGIIAIGKLEARATDQVLDAAGLVLAPGFIDTHSHHDFGLDEAPDAVAAVSQGITTIVVGIDGGSSLPIGDYRQNLGVNPPSVNVASYTGHGALRIAVMGADFKREASADEIARMQALLIEDLENGSLGLSTGLEYDPGIYSNTEEVIALAKTTSQLGGRYISHMRSEDRAFDAAVEELIRIGKEADLPVQISHMKLASTDIWGQAARVLARLEEARAEGVAVTADVYPYTFWQSTLTVLLPERDFNDLDAARYALEKLAPADGLTLVHYAPDQDLVGMTVADIAAARGVSNEETYLQLIRDAYEGYSEEELQSLDKGRESVLGESMTEADIATLMQWPHTNICSDGASQGHPRGFGAFPRAIRKYVREQGIVTLEEMIRKMTALSAEHIGIEDRGEIKKGYTADLVLLDPDTITDNATIEQHDRLSDGIAAVWVNGERVWKEQQATGTRPGVFVARSKSR